MDELKIMVVQTALKEMLKGGHFNICTIKKINEITGAIPRREDMALLEALHCVDFGAMPLLLRQGLPLLIERVLGSERIEFDYKVFGTNIRLAA